MEPRQLRLPGFTRLWAPIFPSRDPDDLLRRWALRDREFSRVRRSPTFVLKLNGIEASVLGGASKSGRIRSCETRHRLTLILFVALPAKFMNQPEISRVKAPIIRISAMKRIPAAG
jgi:hypothetical protein